MVKNLIIFGFNNLCEDNAINGKIMKSCNKKSYHIKKKDICFKLFESFKRFIKTYKTYLSSAKMTKKNLGQKDLNTTVRRTAFFTH